MEQKTQQINIELSEKEAEGIYSNLAIITHSPAEFVMDFTRILPGVPKSKIFARIIMTAQHSKLFLNALKANIDKFESKYGAINLAQESDLTNNFTFPIQSKDEKIN